VGVAGTASHREVRLMHRTERCAFQIPRPGLILANPAPVGILVVGTPSPWLALW